MVLNKIIDLIRSKVALKSSVIILNSMCFLSVNYFYFIVDRQESEFSGSFALFYLYLFFPYLLAVFISIGSDYSRSGMRMFCIVTTLISVLGACWSGLVLSGSGGEPKLALLFIPFYLTAAIAIARIIIIIFVYFWGHSYK